jgi:general secretion pathway protein K
MNKYLIMEKDYWRICRLGERGMALLLTLFVTIILAVVVLEFNYLIRVHATLSGNLVDDLQTQAAARRGIETAKALLLNDLSADTEEGILADTLQEEWASEITCKTSSAVAEVRVTDEMSKLNLNSLVKDSLSETQIESVNQDMVDSVKYLFELLDIDPNLVDGIVDWVDENDQEEPFGAENEYYESLEAPLKCKDGPLDSIEELLLIKGFDSKMLYGDEENPGLAAFVTVFGDAKGSVNINTADEKALAAILKSEAAAQTIVDAREDDPFETSADIAARLPDLELKGRMTTGSSYFLVSSLGALPAEGEPTRQVKIKTFLKRRTPEGLQVEENYLTIETAYWKMER